MGETVKKSAAEWRGCLSPEQYKILREKGTERAFSAAFWDSHDPASYLCAGCGEALFDSETKFESGTGWPSFAAPVAPTVVATEADHSLGVMRVEVTCARCGGHLGHVFPDGPAPHGLRYCINSASLVQRRR